jgi:hypothetical protein
VKGDNIITVNRTTDIIPYSMVPLTGFAGTGFDIEMTFSLQNTYVSVAGGAAVTYVNPGYGDIVNLFQEWKINFVEVMFLYSNNCSQINNTVNLPVLQVAADFVNATATTSSQMLQYQDMKVIQLGNYRGDAGPVFKLKPRFGIGTGPTFIPNGSEWLSTLAPTTQHNCLKVYYDSFASASATSVGSLGFYVRYNISARKSN